MGRKNRKWMLLRQKAVGGEPTYADIVLATSPIAYWPKDEASGITTKNYGSLASIDGTYQGPTLAQVAAPGGGLCPLFGGDGDNVNVYSAAMNAGFPGNEGSIAIWAKVYNAAVWTDGTGRYLFRFSVDGNNEIQASKSADNTVRCVCDIGGDTDSEDITVSSTDWMLWVITWSVTNSRKRYYLNGVLQNTDVLGAVSWTGNLDSRYAVIGEFRSTAPAVSPWYGYIAHMIMWNREISLTTIQTLYNSGL